MLLGQGSKSGGKYLDGIPLRTPGITLLRRSLPHHGADRPHGPGEPRLPVGNQPERYAGAVHKPFPILRHGEIAHAGIARPAVRDDRIAPRTWSCSEEKYYLT